MHWEPLYTRVRCPDIGSIKPIAINPTLDVGPGGRLEGMVDESVLLSSNVCMWGGGGKWHVGHFEDKTFFPSPPVFPCSCLKEWRLSVVWTTRFACSDRTWTWSGCTGQRSEPVCRYVGHSLTFSSLKRVKQRYATTQSARKGWRARLRWPDVESDVPVFHSHARTFNPVPRVCRIVQDITIWIIHYIKALLVCLPNPTWFNYSNSKVTKPLNSNHSTLLPHVLKFHFQQFASLWLLCHHVFETVHVIICHFYCNATPFVHAAL